MSTRTSSATLVARSGNNYSWFNPFQEARYTAEDLYIRLDGWTAEELAFGVVNYDSKEQMMGITALYASVPYQIFGEVMCEVAIERGAAPCPGFDFSHRRRLGYQSHHSHTGSYCRL